MAGVAAVTSARSRRDLAGFWPVIPGCRAHRAVTGAPRWRQARFPAGRGRRWRRGSLRAGYPSRPRTGLRRWADGGLWRSDRT